MTTTETDIDYDTIGWIKASRRRGVILRRLSEGNALPSEIKEDSDLEFSSVSHGLGGLRERGLVELLVDEDRRKGRLYGITPKGERYDEVMNG